MCTSDNLTLRGETPARGEVVELRDFLTGAAAGHIYATDALGSVHAPARAFVERVAGILVVPMSRSPRDYLVFFRHEMVRSVKWAGQPGKLSVAGPHGERLTPRKSFEAWGETVRGHSAPWTEAELRAAEMLRVTLLEVVLHLTGITEDENRAASLKQELLIGELN